jgi:hypothetical protein
MSHRRLFSATAGLLARHIGGAGGGGLHPSQAVAMGVRALSALVGEGGLTRYVARRGRRSRRCCAPMFNKLYAKRRRGGRRGVGKAEEPDGGVLAGPAKTPYKTRGNLNCGRCWARRALVESDDTRARASSPVSMGGCARMRHQQLS